MNKILSNLDIQNQSKMALVNFLGIGVQKSGTTWLDKCLREHPDIYLPPQKEVHFFDRFKNLDLVSSYESVFNFQNEKIIGEITPSYILRPHCAKLIHEYNPNIKLIVILRDPTDRAISQYKMEMSRGSIDTNSGLWDAFNRDLCSIKERGLYQSQLERYYKIFNPSQILVLDYNDISSNPKKLLQKIFKFLKVDINFIPTNINSRIQPVKVENIYIDPKDITKIKKYYDISNYTNI